MSRKAKLNADIQKRICALVNGGAPLTTACVASGVSWNTAKVWMSKGRKGLEPYAEFVSAVKQAKAAWACAATMRITKAGQEDWRASAWLLERRMKEFARPSKVELSGNVNVAGEAELREALERAKRRSE